MSRRKLKANAVPTLLHERVPFREFAEEGLESMLDPQTAALLARARATKSSAYTPLASEPLAEPMDAKFPADHARPDYREVVEATTEILKILLTFLAAEEDAPLFSFDVEAVFQLLEVAAARREHKRRAKDVALRSVALHRLANIYEKEVNWPGNRICDGAYLSQLRTILAAFGRDYDDNMVRRILMPSDQQLHDEAGSVGHIKRAAARLESADLPGVPSESTMTKERMTVTPAFIQAALLGLDDAVLEQAPEVAIAGATRLIEGCLLARTSKHPSRTIHSYLLSGEAPKPIEDDDDDDDDDD